jgi:hypothetical protein
VDQCSCKDEDQWYVFCPRQFQSTNHLTIGLNSFPELLGPHQRNDRFTRCHEISPPKNVPHQSWWHSFGLHRPHNIHGAIHFSENAR